MRGEQMLEAGDIVSAIRQATISAISAVMRAEVPGNIGYLFFLDGEIAHASTLELEGEPAVSAILGWQAATLSWCERRWPRERSVRRRWTELVEVAPELADEPTPEPEVAMRPTLPALPASSGEVHLPSALGMRQALAHGEFGHAVRVASNGNVIDSRGAMLHLKPILSSCFSLGDSLGAVWGLGPLIAAEAAAPGFHRLLARSTEDTSAVETGASSSLQLVRAFLKL
jgi:hypothetical protein